MDRKDNKFLSRKILSLVQKSGDDAWKKNKHKNATEEEKEKAVQRRTKDLATWQNLAGLKMLNATLDHGTDHGN
jgi:hypothetical protein